MARALAWHARGRRFDPDTLHTANKKATFPVAFLLSINTLNIFLHYTCEREFILLTVINKIYRNLKEFTNLTETTKRKQNW